MTNHLVRGSPEWIAYREMHYCQYGAKIRYFSFLSLKKLGRCPRYPDDQARVHYVELSPDLYENNLIIFISHKWLSVSHPDDNPNGGNKYRLLVEGIESILKAYAPGFDECSCYIWFDYGCLDQDDCPTAELQFLDRIVRSADITFTPHFDDDSEIPCIFNSYYLDYKSPMWNGDPHAAYLSRPWCRVEMMYTTHISIFPTITRKLSRFIEPIQEILKMDRRPHVLFVSKDKIPRVLNPLLGEYLGKFEPGSVLENLSHAADVPKIEKLMHEVNLRRKLSEEGYSGETFDDQPHGNGKMIYSDGNVYCGSWRNGKKHGRGKMIYSWGDVYEGEWENDLRCGKGKYCWINGNMYVGDIRNGFLSGQGEIHFSNGDFYRGSFRDGLMDGSGVLEFANGDKYDGKWVKGRKEGEGTYVYANGDIFHGIFANDKIKKGLAPFK